MTIHTNVAAVIADLSDQALRHDLEAVRIRSAIEVLLDIYPNTAAPASLPDSPGTAPAKHAAEEPSSEGSGEMHDRSESISPTIDRAGHIGSWLRSDEKAADAPPAGGAGSASPAPKKPRQRNVDGEYNETANKRVEVAALHAAEPWLTPDEASARLQMPLNNLRIFTQELAIEWAQQPRPEATVVSLASAPTKIARVRMVHAQHPTWTARMIANHLGEKETSVSAMLATVRREIREADAKPEFASSIALVEHYDEVAKRLGKV